MDGVSVRVIRRRECHLAVATASREIPAGLGEAVAGYSGLWAITDGGGAKEWETG